MRVNYAFSNLLGTVYTGGNILFLPDGVTLASPVGNKISFFDLKNHKSETLPIEARLNIVCCAMNRSGTNMLLVTESSDALYISLLSRTILHRHRFGHQVHAVQFSPDEKRVAVCRENDVLVCSAPGLYTHQYNPLLVQYTYHVANDINTCVQWSADSRLFVVGSRDGSSRVCAAVCHKYSNVHPINTQGGHTHPIVAVFFQDIHTYDMMTLDGRGMVVLWQASLSPLQLVKNTDHRDLDTVATDKHPFLRFTKLIKHNYRESLSAGAGYVLSACDYNQSRKLLVAGFDNGAFLLHEMPEFNLIHSLSVSGMSISAVQLNRDADWLAVAAGKGTKGQLLVWEWQSETYVMKQQAHTDQLLCVAYSPDASLIATGAEDGKVKLWSVSSGFCVVTFNEHKSGVTAVAWTQGGKAVLSASRDGSVRAADLKRYRTFRTLVCPRAAQLSCLCVDSAGDIVCAGASDLFDVFVWSLNNGRLLEVLSAHEGPVSGVAFNPLHSILASVSWDKTLRIWDVFSGRTTSETIDLPHDALDVSFSPMGEQVVVVCADSQLLYFDWRRNTQVGVIEARMDLQPGRGRNDQIKSATSALTKSVRSVSYSPDGQLLLAAGQSRHICLYHVNEKTLVNKFKLTTNYSLGAVADDIDRRRVTEFGSAQLWDVSDGEDEHIPGHHNRKLKLPGVRVGVHTGDRTAVPDVTVQAVHFCPTGRSWAAATTEGLLIYSLDERLIFEPYELSVDVSPESVQTALAHEDWGTAIIHALRLNHSALIQHSLECTPIHDVPVLCSSMAYQYCERLLQWLSEHMGNSKHVQFYVLWLRHLLHAHGQVLKTHAPNMMPVFTALSHQLHTTHKQLAMICEHNKYTLRYLTSNQPQTEDEDMEK